MSSDCPLVLAKQPHVVFIRPFEDRVINQVSLKPLWIPNSVLGRIEELVTRRGGLLPGQWVIPLVFEVKFLQGDLLQREGLLLPANFTSIASGQSLKDLSFVTWS